MQYAKQVQRDYYPGIKNRKQIYDITFPFRDNSKC